MHVDLFTCVTYLHSRRLICFFTFVRKLENHFHHQETETKIFNNKRNKPRKDTSNNFDIILGPNYYEKVNQSTRAS